MGITALLAYQSSGIAIVVLTKIKAAGFKICLELLVRGRGRLRCSCVTYADEAQRAWALNNSLRTNCMSRIGAM